MMRTIAVSVLFSLFVGIVPDVSHAQLNQSGPFVGVWCAQGDPAKRTSITANGPFLTLTNEVGSTSSGHVMGIKTPQIVADQWEFVRGTLGPDGRSITWTNGTFWARCPSRRPVDLRGTWYLGGDLSKPCHIDQRGASLSLRNESGQTASGSLTGKHSLSTVWSGTTITGRLTDHNRRILWSNGTYWTRS